MLCLKFSRQKPGLLIKINVIPGFPGGSASKESACNAGDLGVIPGLKRSPGEVGIATHSSILAWRILWAV